MFLKPGPEVFPQIALATGILTLLPALLALAAPARAEKIIKAFPRSVWPGRIIIAVCIVWTMLWLVVMPFQFLAVLHPYLWILTPLAIWAVCFHIPELLSCRAFGCLIAMLPTVMLSSAQWHPSPWRYAMITYAYALAVFGMFYIGLPYLMRDHIAWAYASRMRARAVATAFAVIGFAVIISSFTR